MLKSLLRAGLTVLCVAIASQGFAAEPWPSKRITLVVPFTAGGSTDVVARILANKLAAELGQPVIVENKPGASGNIAGEFVAKSPADGYTLFVGTSTSIANITLFKTIPFDILKDFVPVSQIAHTPLVLMVNPSFSVNNVADLVKYAKQNPGKLNYGSGGSGTSQHLGGVMFEHMAGVKMVHVPYKGAAPAVTDLLAGNIQVMFAPLIDGLPLIKGGKLKALGLTTPKTAPQVPEVAPIATVLPGFDVATWNAIFAPVKTPPDVMEKLSGAIVKVMKQPDVRKAIEEQGSEAIGSTPAEFRKFIDNEVVVWKKLVEISGAKAD
jgi:tripartite-type tricarboxylate transporter receptor subunit TctC